MKKLFPTCALALALAAIFCSAVQAAAVENPAGEGLDALNISAEFLAN
jgi:hypothetical protein